MTYIYYINHFRVESDMELAADPRLLPDGTSPVCSVSIRLAKEPLEEFSQAVWLVRRFGGLLRTYDVGRGILICFGIYIKMLVARDGSAITIQAGPEHVSKAMLYAQNVGLSLCALLRGALPLHAAGAEIDGARIAILAPSGMGKSTLLWTLLRHGACFANDDVVPVLFGDGEPCAAASVSLWPKLRRSAIEQFLINPRDCREILPGEGEYWYDIDAAQRISNTRPLTALFALQPAPNENAEISCKRLAGTKALSLIMENLHGVTHVWEIIDRRHIAVQCMQLLQRTPLYVVHYPKRFEILPELVQILRSQTKGASYRETIVK